jgi:hypothetical protein
MTAQSDWLPMTIATGAAPPLDLPGEWDGFSIPAAIEEGTKRRKASASAAAAIGFTGEAGAFALPMLLSIIVAALTPGAIEMRLANEARLSDEEVAERRRARDGRRAAGSSATR